jgi:hypothetical protein
MTLSAASPLSALEHEPTCRTANTPPSGLKMDNGNERTSPLTSPQLPNTRHEQDPDLGVPEGLLQPLSHAALAHPTSLYGHTRITKALVLDMPTHLGTKILPCINPNLEPGV